MYIWRQLLLSNNIMRLVKTKTGTKIGVIAATKGELSRMKNREYMRQFLDAISIQPVKNEQYQCFVMVYSFTDVSRLKLFRLAYAQTMKRTKHVKVARAYKPKLCKWTKARTRKRADRRRLIRQRKRSRTRYFKLLPLLKAGNITTIEAKAREIARINQIIDLL